MSEFRIICRRGQIEIFPIISSPTTALIKIIQRDMYAQYI